MSNRSSSSASASASASVDSNNWVRNPPSVYVKVHGTTRAALNGQFGLVVQYTAASGQQPPRYTVLLCEAPQDVVSLRADNLVQCGRFVEHYRAQLTLMRNHPQLQRQWQSVSTQIQQTTGVSLGVAAMAVGAILILGWVTLGFSKLLLIVTALMIVGSLIGPELLSAASSNTNNTNNSSLFSIVRHVLPRKWRDMVRTQIPVVGPRIAANTILLNVCSALVVAFFLYSLAASTTNNNQSSRNTNNNYSSPSSTSSFSSSFSATTAATASTAREELQQRFYALGFEDATNAKVFGASLAAAAAQSAAEQQPSNDKMASSSSSSSSVGGVDENPTVWSPGSSSSRTMDDPSLYYRPPPPPPKPSPLNPSTAFAAFTLFGTLRPLAMNTEGQFDLALLRANLSTLPVWKLGLMGFCAYRIVAAFL